MPLPLTVQLYLIQSSQNREAENFFRITTVMPWSRHCPIPTMFPEGRVGLAVREMGDPSLYSLLSSPEALSPGLFPVLSLQH